jgi:hypothetical protein
VSAQPPVTPSPVQAVLWCEANGTAMSTTLGCRYLSPRSDSPCPAMAARPARASASCSARSSGPRPLRFERMAMISPIETDRLVRINAAEPAALLVIQ